MKKGDDTRVRPLRYCPNCGRRGPEHLCPEDDVPTFEDRPLVWHTAPTGYVGEVLGGRYQLEELVGESCVGCAFRGLDFDTGDSVAVKVLRRRLSGSDGAFDRFRTEVAASLLLRSDHTVQLRDFALSEDGRAYAVWNFLVGRTLQDALEEVGPFPAPRAVDIATAVCTSLAEAHEHGLLHRDLKPSNVFLVPTPDGDEHVRVLNLGLGCFVPGVLRDPVLRAYATTNGGYRYLSPEQVRGEPVDPRSDLYSLGVLLYELLFGALPFSAELIDERPGGTWRLAPPPVPGTIDSHPIGADLRELVRELLHPCVVGRPPTAWRVAERLRVIRSRLAAEPHWQRGLARRRLGWWFGARRPARRRITAALTRLLGV